ncbi:MAG: aminotransferase class III-fold pyridoxal phosphate-dependent enzyme, partial [Flavobacteriales bacterium]|nr:aminotransferase class III-fold pyridoxal phosphate-dependent enzyme [Flavobacteriales bacterium]
FTANPIACAVACANLDLFERKETWEIIELIGKWNREFALKLGELDCVEKIRQQGTILAFEIKTGEGNTYFSDIKTQAYNHFLQDGILLRPLGNVIFLNPPYCITKEEYNKIETSILGFLTI